MTPSDPLIEELRSVPPTLRALAADVPDSQLRRPPSAGGFTVLEHVCHLRDYDDVCLQRMLRMLVESSPRLEDFAGHRTAAVRGYAGQSLAAAVDDFSAHRETMVRILTTLSAGQLDRDAMLEPTGRITIGQLAEMVAAHDRTHAREIAVLLDEIHADAAADVEAIRRIAEEFTEGFNSGDLDRMMRLHGDRYVDVNLRVPVQSRDERRAYYAALARRPAFRVQVHPDEIVVHGSVAFGRGRIELIDRRGVVTTELRYLEVLRKEADEWKAMWGMDGPVQDYVPEGT